jgi:hypothetical protein
MAPDCRRGASRLAVALLTVLVLLALGACAALPPLRPQLTEQIPTPPFPQGRWQLVHRIEARFPGNHKALMMGALELDSATGRLSCALMTVEGFTLFSAGFDPNASAPLTITRAVPPFDGPGFAEGLMADLRLLFFEPRGACLQIGTVGQHPVWRYHHRDGSTTDVKALQPDQFRIERYTADNKRVRKAELRMTPSSAAGQGMAQEILLETLDEAGYALQLDLIDAVPLSEITLNE